MFNILLVGVGGQGVLTMFKVLGNAAQREGLFVNGAETHGMSQRGGSVYVHLRIHDQEIHSPLIMKGAADLLVALEPVEALRFAPFIKKTGNIITSLNPVEPPNLALKKEEYPPVLNIISKLHEYTSNVIALDYIELLGNLGVKNVNMAFIGTMSSLANFPISKDEILKEIKTKLSRFWNEANQAFNIGYNYSTIIPAE